MDKSYDVTIVGAGLAGLAAAWSASEEGLSVLCVDKKVHIADGISCAEGIAESLLGKVPFKIPKRIFSWKVKGISFFCDDFNVERTGTYWKGYTINRVELEKWLAKKAKKSGAEIHLESAVKDLKSRKNNNQLRLETRNESREIESAFLIAADGANSSMAKILGLGREECLGHILSWEYKNIKLRKPNLEQIYYGPFSPAGYSYIFPKSTREANVGVGTTFKKDLKPLYKKFINLPRVSEQLSMGLKVREKSGVAIINRDIPLEFNRILFAGDAGNVNLKPFVEGIIPSMCSGYLAGKNIKEFKKGSYKKELRKLFKQEYSYSDSFLKLFLKIREKRNQTGSLLLMGFSSQIFDISEYENLKKMSLTELSGTIKSRL